jgi:hypothetical protein
MSTFSLVPLHRVAVHVPESRRRAESRRRPGPEPPRVSREGERRVCASQRAGCDMGRLLAWAACTVQMGRVDTVHVGRVLMCNWAVCGFGPVTVELFFYFPNIFKYLKIQKFV